jgi:DNA helicase-2/ATP-dependent DNA helicase PcrA
VEQIEQYALVHGTSLWGALERMLEEKVFPGRAEAALTVFHRLIAELASALKTDSVASILRAVMERTGYRKMLEDEGTPDAQSRLANLDELLNAAVDANERGESIREFLDHAALVADADSNDERAPVSLLTMHNAKGLEFPVVFVAGME